VTWAVPEPRGVHNTLFALNPHSSLRELQTYFVFGPDFGTEAVVRSKKTYDSSDKLLGGSPYEKVYQDKDTIIALYDVEHRAGKGQRIGAAGHQRHSAVPCSRQHPEREVEADDRSTRGRNAPEPVARAASDLEHPAILQRSDQRVQGASDPMKIPGCIPFVERLGNAVVIDTPRTAQSRISMWIACGIGFRPYGAMRSKPSDSYSAMALRIDGSVSSLMRLYRRAFALPSKSNTSARPIPVPRAAGRTYSLFISQIPGSSGLRPTHAAASPLTIPTRSAPSGLT
jgi:hypothetical protein